MPAVDPSNVPDVTVKQLVLDGVAALSANVALLAGIWKGLADDDIAKLTAFWGEHPPSVLTGFARRTDPFPCFAITLASDAQDTALLDDGQFLDEDEDADIGRETTTCVFRIYVFAENPDVCAAYYRVLRRILMVGKRQLESRGLYNPSLSGAELAPDPSYTPDNLFTRQVTLTVLLEESWSMSSTDALAAALLPTQPTRLSPSGEVNVAHTDSGGGVNPVTRTP